MTLSNPPSWHSLLLILRIWKSCHNLVVPLTVHNVERRFRLDIDDAIAATTGLIRLFTVRALGKRSRKILRNDADQ